MLTQVHHSVTHQNQLAHHVHDVVEALGIDANGGFTPTVTSRIFASWLRRSSRCGRFSWRWLALGGGRRRLSTLSGRSEEHTSELQSRGHLVCRLLLEQKNDLI